MPIFGSGIGSRTQLSTLVILNSQQPSVDIQRPTCNRAVIQPIADPLPNGMEIVNLTGMEVRHLGSSQYWVRKTAADGFSNGEVYNVTDITGDFVLRIQSNSGSLSTWTASIGMATGDPTTVTAFESADYGFLVEAGGSPRTERFGVRSAFISDPTVPLWLGRIGDTMYWKEGLDWGTATVDDTQTGVSGIALQLDTSFYHQGADFTLQLFTTTGYSLAAGFGTFTYTGQAAALERGYALAAANATFAYTGQVAGLTSIRLLPAGLGTFTYTGQTALLERGYNLAAGQAAFTYSGQAAGLVAAYLSPAALGAFSYTGQAALLERGYPMSAGLGTFSYSGQSTVYELGYVISAGAGVFAYTGQAAAFLAHVSMPGANGSFSYTGEDARAILNLASLPPGGSGVRVTAAFFR